MTEYQRHRRGSESDGFFCRFTFGQFFAILLLEIFTLIFVFYLGARFGGDFLGLQQKAPIAQSQVEQQIDDRLADTSDPEIQAMAKELIAKAKTPELKEQIANMLGVSANTESKQQVVKSETSSAVKKVEARSEKQKVTISEVAPTKKKTSITPTGAIRIKSTDGARYSIQVGSYPELAEANDSVDKWRKSNRGRWYRVRIGGFGTRSDADVYMQELVGREKVEALVVLNEQ